MEGGGEAKKCWRSWLQPNTCLFKWLYKHNPVCQLNQQHVSWHFWLQTISESFIIQSYKSHLPSAYQPIKPTRKWSRKEALTIVLSFLLTFPATIQYILCGGIEERFCWTKQSFLHQVIKSGKGRGKRKEQKRRKQKVNPCSTIFFFHRQHLQIAFIYIFFTR